MHRHSETTFEFPGTTEFALEHNIDLLQYVEHIRTELPALYQEMLRAYAQDPQNQKLDPADIRRN